MENPQIWFATIVAVIGIAFLLISVRQKVTIDNNWMDQISPVIDEIHRKNCNLWIHPCVKCNSKTVIQETIVNQIVYVRWVSSEEQGESINREQEPLAYRIFNHETIITIQSYCPICKEINYYPRPYTVTKSNEIRSYAGREAPKEWRKTKVRIIDPADKKNILYDLSVTQAQIKTEKQSIPYYKKHRQGILSRVIGIIIIVFACIWFSVILYQSFL